MTEHRHRSTWMHYLRWTLSTRCLCSQSERAAVRLEHRALGIVAPGCAEVGHLRGDILKCAQLAVDTPQATDDRGFRREIQPQQIRLETFGVLHTKEFVAQVLPKVLRIALLPDEWLAEADHVAVLEHNALGDVRAPD